MKRMTNNLIIALLVLLISFTSQAQVMETTYTPQTTCAAIDALIKEAPNGFYKYHGQQVDERNITSLFVFPGADKSTIEMNSGVPVFKAYLEESNDKDLLLKRYDEVSAEIKACLKRKYVVTEIMKDDGIGRIMEVTRKRRKRNKAKIFLEFSKADMSTASYYLRLNVMNED